MDRPLERQPIVAGASPEEAAAIVAVLEAIRPAVPILPAEPAPPSLWLAAALREGVERSPR